MVAWWVALVSQVSMVSPCFSVPEVQLVPEVSLVSPVSLVPVVSLEIPEIPGPKSFGGGGRGVGGTPYWALCR